MIFENLKLEKVIFSNTLKKRSWYRFKIGDQLFTYPRCYQEVLDEFRNECDEELKGLYRNHKIGLTEEQEAWKKQLIQTKYSFFLTIKLPHTNQDGYRRTRIRTEALESYRKLIQELEEYFSGNNWKRNPLQFTGVLEQGKAGFWHVHLAIPSSENDLYIADRLCGCITKLINKHNFYKTVIDLRAVHDQEGLCMYMVKELKKHQDEGSEIFDLRTLFKGIKKDRYIIRLSLKALSLLVRCGLWIKQFWTFNVHTKIRYVKKKLFQKRFNRCGSKINPTTNLDSV